MEHTIKTLDLKVEQDEWVALGANKGTSAPGEPYVQLLLKELEKMVLMGKLL